MNSTVSAFDAAYLGGTVSVYRRAHFGRWGGRWGWSPRVGLSPKIAGSPVGFPLIKPPKQGGNIRKRSRPHGHRRRSLQHLMEGFC